MDEFSGRHKPTGKAELMARSDLLVALVKAGASGDKNLLRSSAEALIADERSKQHHLFADRLGKALQSNGNGSLVTSLALTSTSASPSANDFFITITPKRQLEELFLPAATRRSCDQLIEEQRRADVLRSHALEPRHRILLSGPPGNGKTTLAEAIGESLNVPLLAVRYEAVIGSFLGETASRVRRVFDFARSMPCVLFFDEFDSIGKERGDIHETGEIKRVVSSLLLQIDALPSWTVVVAATNHSELLDRAVWRRFQLRLQLPAPTERQLSEFISKFFSTREISEPLGHSHLQLARSLGGTSFAEAEEFCANVLRRIVLSLGAERARDIVDAELIQWRARVRAPNSHRKSYRRGRKTAPSTSNS
jgi:AAA+ superfamily predicted ATPase